MTDIVLRNRTSGKETRDERQEKKAKKNGRSSAQRSSLNVLTAIICAHGPTEEGVGSGRQSEDDEGN